MPLHAPLASPSIFRSAERMASRDGEPLCLNIQVREGNQSLFSARLVIDVDLH